MTDTDGTVEGPDVGHDSAETYAEIRDEFVARLPQLSEDVWGDVDDLFRQFAVKRRHDRTTTDFANALARVIGVSYDAASLFVFDLAGDEIKPNLRARDLRPPIVDRLERLANLYGDMLEDFVAITVRGSRDWSRIGVEETTGVDGKPMASVRIELLDEASFTFVTSPSGLVRLVRNLSRSANHITIADDADDVLSAIDAATEQLERLRSSLTKPGQQEDPGEPSGLL